MPRHFFTAGREARTLLVADDFHTDGPTIMPMASDTQMNVLKRKEEG
jgi:hypothetical protein